MGTRQAVARISIQLESTIKNILDAGHTPEHKVGGPLIADNLKNGAEVDQSNRAIRRTWTISSGNSEDIDVFDFGSVDIGAGTGNDALGQSWDAEELVLFYLMQTAGDGRCEVNVSSPSNPLPWMPTLTVANGAALRNNAGFLFYSRASDAFPVTDASAHTVRLTANGGDVTVDLILFGRNDDNPSSSSASSSTSSSTSSTGSSSRSSSSTNSSSSVSSSSTSTVSSVSSSTVSSSSQS